MFDSAILKYSEFCGAILRMMHRHKPPKIIFETICLMLFVRPAALAMARVKIKRGTWH